MALSPEEVNNLSSLLLSVDDKNTQLAFEIIDAKEFPKSLLTEVFVIFKISKNDRIREKAAAFLNEHYSFDFSEIKRSGILLSQEGGNPPTEKTILKNIDKYVEMSGGRLDGMKMALALFNKYDVGFQYLLKKLPENLKLELLKKFINGTTFKLHHRNLTTIPKELYQFTELTEIDLSYNHIKTIPSKIKSFKNLEVLCLHSNKLTKLDKALEKCSKLERLDISENRFDTLPPVVTKLKSLKYLNIDSLQYISGLGVEVPIPTEIGDLKNVEEIVGADAAGSYGYSQGLGMTFMNYPDFSVVKSTDGTPLNLEPEALAKYAYEQNGKSEGVAYLFEHSEDSEFIKRIIQEQFYHEQIKTLDLKATMLLHIPKEVAAFEVEHFNGSGAFLGSPHSASGEFKNLRSRPDASPEIINKRFEALAAFKDIKTADLSENRLTILPEACKEWKGLKKLDLSKNDFKEIPAEIGDFPDLEILLLYEPFRYDWKKEDCYLIPDSLAKLTKLKKLQFFESNVGKDDAIAKAAYLKRFKELLPDDCEILLER